MFIVYEYKKQREYTERVPSTSQTISRESLAIS